MAQLYSELLNHQPMSCFGSSLGKARVFNSSKVIAPSTRFSYVPLSNSSLAARFKRPIAAYDALGPKLTRATPSLFSSLIGGNPFLTITFVGKSIAFTNHLMEAASVRP